jgi:toxin ParE1/3/4
MSFRIVIREPAERDMAEASAWYEARSRGLGARFILSIEASLARISRNPEASTLCFERFRRVLVRRFPYGIFYLVESQRIIVLAVLHLHQNPLRIQKTVETS